MAVSAVYVGNLRKEVALNPVQLTERTAVGT